MWSDKLKYLGVLFVSGKNLSIDIIPVLCKFYTSANARKLNREDAMDHNRWMKQIRDE